MKLYITITTALLVTLTAFADEFFLKLEDTGEVYGPFRFENGAHVGAGNQRMILLRLPTKNNLLIQKLREIMIPELDFRKATLADIVGYFVAKSRELDSAKQGVNIVIHNLLPKKKNPYHNAKAPPYDEINHPEYIPDDGPPVTFQANGISLHDALATSCRLAGASFSEEDGVVVVTLGAQPVQQSAGSDSTNRADAVRGSLQQ